MLGGGHVLKGTGNVDWRTFVGTAMALLNGQSLETIAIMAYVCDKTYKALLGQSANLWSYLLVDACLNTPQGMAIKMFRWANDSRLAFETRALLGRLQLPMLSRSPAARDWASTAADGCRIRR